MSKKGDWLQFMRESGTFELQELYRSFNIGKGEPKHQVRNFVQNLREQEVLQRVGRGIYEYVQDIFRHYLSALAYCHGKKQQFYALTFSEDNDDLESELFNAIIENTVEGCGNHTDTGYEVSENDEGMNSDNTYPEIEVGSL